MHHEMYHLPCGAGESSKLFLSLGPPHRAQQERASTGQATQGPPAGPHLGGGTLAGHVMLPTSLSWLCALPARALPAHWGPPSPVGPSQEGPTLTYIPGKSQGFPPSCV